MAVTLTASTTAQGTEQVTVQIPAGAGAGDTLVAFVSDAVQGSGVSVSLPSGWARAAGTGDPLFGYSRKLSAPLTGTVSFTSDPFHPLTAVVLLLKGADTVGTASVLKPANGQTGVLTHPGLSGLTRSSMVLWFERPTSQAEGSYGAPPSFTAAPSAVRGYLGVAARTYPTAGSTGAVAVVDRIQYAAVVGLLEVTATNTAPNAPSLGTSGSLNRAAPNIIDWEHDDPDGDGQSAARIFDRLVGAASWTQIDVPGPNSRYEAPALSLALGQHEYQVQTADTFGSWGPRSSSGFFLVANPPAGPAITAPINNSTVGVAQVEVTWTGTGTSWEVRSVAEVGGAADPSTVYYLSGEQQVASVGRRWVVPLPVNSRRERIQVREKASGLFGDWSDVGIQVSYTLPGVVGASVQISSFALTVVAGTPTATGGEPPIAYLEIERGRVGADGTITTLGFLRALDRPGRVRAQVGPRGTYSDGTVRSGVDYAYRWHAVGQNGTRSVGPWATGPVDFGIPNEGVFADAVFSPAVFG